MKNLFFMKSFDKSHSAELEPNPMPMRLCSAIKKGLFAADQRWEKVGCQGDPLRCEF